MWLQWFGDQSEAVKLAILGLLSAFGAGVFGIFKEWRKPVLAAQTPPAANRPKDDDPLLLLASAVEGMNFALAEVKRSVDGGADRSDQLMEHIEKLVEELRDVRQEIAISREVLSRTKL